MLNRRFRSAILCLCLAIGWSTALQLHAVAHSTQALQVQRVAAVAITVADLDRSLAFYTNVLTFEKVSEQEVTGDEYEKLYGVFGSRIRIAHIRLGNEYLDLMEYLAPKGRSIPEDSRSNDRWFQHVAIIVSDMDRAYRVLRDNKVTYASSGPQTLPEWNKNASGIQAFYFKDPDGHPLEILQFPEGKGDAKWHQSSDRLFLGIDRTAIVVADTEASLSFYRDLLGMHVAGESDNYGTEQEHLNNVFGARLRITSLRAISGPGVELLEYLSPRDGRSFPADEHANDLVHRHTIFEIADAHSALASLRSAHVAFISPGDVAIENRNFGFRDAILVRDPDGHAINIIQR
jgi:catechol 2,3-dioxygenase-like lactoylglutathione lyase family enzyme